MRILITGANGQLGQALQANPPSWADITALTSRDLDITNGERVHEKVATLRPAWIMNAAAYTAVDKAEEEPGQAKAVNETAVRHLAEAANINGARLLHVSTDFVFDGTANRPYLPDDDTNPVNVYGRTKLAGEQAFLESGVNGALVRVAWLYDAEGHNFMNTMLRLAEAHGALKVVDDQHGCPTAVPVLAEALLDMALRGADMPQGVWHFAHEGHTTWQGFATEIMRVAGWDVPVEPVGSEAFPTPAQRPAWSVLDGGPLREQMGWPKCTWEDALAQVWALKQAGG